MSLLNWVPFPLPPFTPCSELSWLVNSGNLWCKTLNQQPLATSCSNLSVQDPTVVIVLMHQSQSGPAATGLINNQSKHSLLPIRPPLTEVRFPTDLEVSPHILSDDNGVPTPHLGCGCDYCDINYVKRLMPLTTFANYDCQLVKVSPPTISRA